VGACIGRIVPCVWRHGNQRGRGKPDSMHVTPVNQLITPHGITIAKSSVPDPYVFGYGMFFGLLDPDPLVRSTDPDPPIFPLVIWRSGSGSFYHQAKIVRKSFSQRHGSADPDPYQKNDMDLQHWPNQSRVIIQ
jgi:hypothetical protein